MSDVIERVGFTLCAMVSVMVVLIVLARLLVMVVGGSNVDRATIPADANPAVADP
jgi:hypothetical protein